MVPVIQRVRMAGMPKKTVNRAPLRWREGSTQFAQQLESAVTAPPLVVCVVWSRQIGVNSSILDRRQVEQGFFMESNQSYAATEPLTTGPDYDPLLLLLSLAGDMHPNPAPPRYPCSGVVVCHDQVRPQVSQGSRCRGS